MKVFSVSLLFLLIVLPVTVSAQDTTPPPVSSIVLLNANPTNASNISFAVTFSETVTGFVPGDVTVSPTGTVTSTGVSITGSDANYVVTVEGLGGDGSFTITIPVVSPAIIDASNNPISGSLTSSLVTIDTTAPTMSAVAPRKGDTTDDGTG